jgi:methionine biosynthesis protein MetW
MNDVSNDGLARVATPDTHARGFVEANLDALRYDEPSDEPDETAYVLRRLMPAKARVLDVGCGTGSLTLAVTKEADAEVLGIEPDPQRAEHARKRGLKVVCGVADPDLLRKLGLFDVIILADVVEHLAEPADLLAELRSALAPGGRILASVPNVAHWTVRLRLLIGNSIISGRASWMRRTFAGSPALLAEAFRTMRLRCFINDPTAGVWMPEYAAFPSEYFRRGGATR